MPRKYKIAFSGSEEDKAFATVSDLGFIAKMKNGKRGFSVYIAGGMGAKSVVGNLLFDFVEHSNVYRIAKAVKNLFFKYGNRKNKHAARLRFLWQSLGEKEFKKRLQEELTLVDKENFLPLNIELSKSKTEGVGVLNKQESIEFQLWKKRYVASQKQRNYFSVTIPVELGFFSCEHAKKLAVYTNYFGEDVLRLTRNQNIVLRNIDACELESLFYFLRNNLTGIGIDKPSFYANVLSCAGASTCQLGFCLSRQATKAILRNLETSGLDLDKLGDFRFNISGCPNSCGQHPIADFGFSGKALRKDGHLYPAYTIYAGAVLKEGSTQLAQALGDVPAKALPNVVSEFFKSYLESGSKTIREYILADGSSVLKNIILNYKEPPSFEEEKNFYYDWGSESVFSLVGRGTGECSASLFDLIGIDQKNIEKVRQDLSCAEGQIKEKWLNDLLFFSSRMLLVTRGMEPKTNEEVYDAFKKNFIDADYIDKKYESIVLDAKSGTLKSLEHQEKIVALSFDVETLFAQMDNGFNFKKLPADLKNASGKENQKVTLMKDLRGVLCPLNFVKTKVELAKIHSGDTLEIWLDDGAPIDNVPGSIKAEGHKIVSQKKIDQYWSVIIEKK